MSETENLNHQTKRLLGIPVEKIPTVYVAIVICYLICVYIFSLFQITFVIPTFLMGHLQFLGVILFLKYWNIIHSKGIGGDKYP